MDPADIISLIVLLILIMLSAFFSSAETVFSTVNKIRLENLSEEGNKKAKLALRIISNYSKMLSTVLIGNNVVNISASSLATIFATKVWGNWAVSIATGILTLIVLLFGEIVPKTWAKLNSEKLSLAYAPIISSLCTILTPVVFIVDKLSNGILRLLRIDPNKKVVSITENELLSYVDAGHEEGVIESEEKEMIYNLFDFSDSLAKDIMIPRIDIIETDVNTTYDELKELFKTNMYTRIPVYEESLDNIIGVVNVKDFLFVDNVENFMIKDIMREVYYTYEYKKTIELLNEMRENTETITIVLNEYGAAEGMITLEDLLEEIVGDIKDEYDQDERDSIKSVNEREFLIEGSMKIDDINDKLKIELVSENYDSIGGMIIDNLDDRLPEEGESVFLENGITLKVESFTNNRINTVRLTLPTELLESKKLINNSLNEGEISIE